MSSDREHDEERVAREILEYFLRNPQSADSLEGVAHWRLLDETIHRTLAETRDALERLVAEGYLRRVSVPGSEFIYSLDPRKKNEAESFIRTSSSDPPAKS
jgi:hypothetical protein